MTITWTLAYRHPRANHFKRVTNWEGTWHQAHELASKVTETGVQVYYVRSAASELDEQGRLKDQILRGEISQETAQRYVNDHGNILVDSGRRVRIRETGKLSDDLLAQVPDATEAKSRFEANTN